MNILFIVKAKFHFLIGWLEYKTHHWNTRVCLRWMTNLGMLIISIHSWVSLAMCKCIVRCNALTFMRSTCKNLLMLPFEGTTLHAKGTSRTGFRFPTPTGEAVKTCLYGFVGFVCRQRLCINFSYSRVNFLTILRSHLIFFCPIFGPFDLMWMSILLISLFEL